MPDYFARVIRDQHTGTIMLQVIGDMSSVVEVNDGDEFVTFTTPAALPGDER